MSVGKVRYTRRAREDILDIWVYIAPRNARAADRVYDRIEESCALLKFNPHLGPARPDIGEGARALVIEHWIALGAKYIGGCCRTKASDILRIKNKIKSLSV